MRRTDTEASFQTAVLQYARLTGWMWYHTHDSRRSPAGFPDLVLCRERVLFVELKIERGRTTPAQEEWLARLRAAGAEVYLWRPSMWHEIEATLARPS